MADAREIPLVVQGHDHGLTSGHDTLQSLQREETLIDPMQVNDVGPVEDVHRRDIGTHIGDIDLKQVLPAQAVG